MNWISLKWYLIKHDKVVTALFKFLVLVLVVVGNIISTSIFSNSTSILILIFYFIYLYFIVAEFFSSSIGSSIFSSWIIYTWNGV